MATDPRNDDVVARDAADEDQIDSRAELTAEEKVAGSDDPHAQAEAILEDSEARVASREAAPGTHLEHRTSEDATPPVDTPPD
jgi:hypothetical protein